jgi:uncharacterized membrane protein
MFFDHIQPHKFFLAVSIAFGIIYTIVTPPLQAPDEHDHFKRAYHISAGHFFPQKQGLRLGGEMPVSFKKYMIPYRFAATNLKYTLNQQTLINSFDVPLNDSEKEFDDFPNTSLYSPVCYLPQALAMFITRHFNCSPAFMYYFGRFFVFLVWAISMYCLVKIIPIAKWLFTFILLLPMNLFISNSFSADTVTNILSLTFVVLVLKYAFDEKQFTAKRLFFLVLVGIFLALAKVVYTGLILTFFIIPAHKFNSKKQILFYSSILFSCAFTAALWWSKVVMQYFTSYLTYDPVYRAFCCLSPCADYAAQKSYILNHGTYLFKVIYHSLFDHPYTYMAGYIGSFGNNDITFPKWLLPISYILILIIALTEKNPKSLSLFQKIILSGSSFFAFVLLLLSQHLTWDCVGEGVVDVVQGRYLIPLFPLVFLFFTNILSKFKINLQVFIIAVVFINNFIACKLIYNRYFTESYLEKLEFTCGAEEVNENGLFKTSNPEINLEGVSSKNDRISHSGRSSILLSEKNPYGFTCKFKNLSYGDLIEVSGWQKGEGAQMIVSGKGKNCGDFYYTNWDLKYKDNKGWSRMEYAFTMNQKCTAGDSTEVGFFVWNPGKTKTYIDDLKFSIKKFALY